MIVKPDLSPPLSRRAMESGCASFDGVAKRRDRRRADARKALRQMQSNQGVTTLNIYECGKCRVGTLAILRGEHDGSVY
jgi:hypothetical protein